MGQGSVPLLRQQFYLWVSKVSYPMDKDMSYLREFLPVSTGIGMNAYLHVGRG